MRARSPFQCSKQVQPDPVLVRRFEVAVDALILEPVELSCARTGPAGTRQSQLRRDAATKASESSSSSKAATTASDDLHVHVPHHTLAHHFVVSNVMSPGPGPLHIGTCTNSK